MTERRIKKRHIAAAGAGTTIAGILLTWSQLAPMVCPVLPQRVAEAICAPSLLKATAALDGAADGGVP